MLGAGLAAQEAGERVGGGRGEDGGLELQHLPRAVVVLDRGGVGAGEQGQLGDGGERALVELDAHSGGAVEARGGAGGQRIERDAGDGGRQHHRLELEARVLRRAVDGDGAGPGGLRGRDVAGGGRLVAAQQRQVEEHDEGLAGDDADAPPWPRAPPRGVGVDIGVEAAGLDVARAVLADLGDAQQARAAVGGKRDDIAGLQRQAARRQRERGALAGGPGLEQPDLGDLGGLLGLERERKIGQGNAAAAAGEAARFLHGRRDSRRRRRYR